MEGLDELPRADAAFGSCATATADDIDSTSAAMKIIERFVVVMYDRTSPCMSVNECRRVLYTRKNRSVENIPPTADALLQHVKRPALQSHIWQDCLTSNAPYYEPIKWGWICADDSSYICTAMVHNT